MRFNLTLMSIFTLFLSLPFPIHASQDHPLPAEPQNQLDQLEEPMFKPFIERYILDELKQLRNDQQLLRVELTEKIAHLRLDASDRAIRYTADTTNNIFLYHHRFSNNPGTYWLEICSRHEGECRGHHR